MLACIRDVGGGKLRIHTYRTGRRGHLATESRKRHFDPPPLAGATSRENFRTKTAVANPVEPDHRQGADGSLASTPERISRRRETSALPPPHLGAGSPSVSVWCLCPSSVQSSPSPPAHSPYPSMQRRSPPPPPSATPHHCPAGGCGPGSRPRGTAAQHRSAAGAKTELCTQVPFPLPAWQKATTQLNKQLPTPTHGWKNRGAQIHTPTHNPHTRAAAAAAQQQATTKREITIPDAAPGPGHRGSFER